MTEQIEMPPESLAPRGVGPQLRIAREKLGLTIEQVAAETRISQRHIENIEAGDFDALPGRTYAVGFARNIAKVVQLDHGDVAAMVRAELDEMVPEDERRQRSPSFEPGDPARAPSGRLVWFSLFAVALLLAGLFAFARMMFAPAAELPSLVEQEQAEEAEAAALAAAAEAEAETPIGADAEVTFTALRDGVWVRFYDASGQRLMETELAQGESYTVPADANGPQLWTGRPDALQVNVGGRALGPLAPEMETLQDVPVDAAALLARLGQAVAPPPATTSLTSTSRSAPTTPATARPATRQTPAQAAVEQPEPAPAATATPAPAPSATAAPQPSPEPTPASAQTDNDSAGEPAPAAQPVETSADDASAGDGDG